jgi:hypothetical protein
MKRLSLAFTLVGFLAAAADVGAQESQTICSQHWANGIDQRLMLQQPDPQCIQVVNNAGRSVLKVSINSTQDYSHVANGAPRAEVSFGNLCRFERGKEYLIRWSSLIPQDFEFDSMQPEGIAQIHEGSPSGSPPFGLNLNGSQYQVRVQGRTGATTIGDASGDKGRWVQWSLRYKPDDSGTDGITELYKDNKVVLNANGTPNAWQGDDRAYFKMGIYKWWWQSRPSAVTDRTMYFGDVAMSQR